jgi:4-hydroxy-2-oxoheptanedioate aldolase
MEHGAHSLDNLANFVRAAELAGGTLLLRPPQIDAGLIQRAQDTGCHGLMVPNIRTPECDAKLIDCFFYPPMGNRGLSPYTRAFGFDGKNVPEKMAAWNDEGFLGILVEGPEGIGNLETICQKYADKLDVVYIGLYDLAKTLNSTHDLMSPVMTEKVAAVAKLASSFGVQLGILANSPEMLTFAASLGINFIAYQNDTAILHAAASGIRNNL